MDLRGSEHTRMLTRREASCVLWTVLLVAFATAGIVSAGMPGGRKILALATAEDRETIVVSAELVNEPPLSTAAVSCYPTDVERIM